MKPQIRRLKDMPDWYKRKLVWTCEDAETMPYRELYYAARAVECYGSAVRDNTYEQLVSIGKRIEREGSPE